MLFRERFISVFVENCSSYPISTDGLYRVYTGLSFEDKSPYSFCLRKALLRIMYYVEDMRE